LNARIKSIRRESILNSSKKKMRAPLNLCFKVVTSLDYNLSSEELSLNLARDQGGRREELES